MRGLGRCHDSGQLFTADGFFAQQQAGGLVQVIRIGFE